MRSLIPPRMVFPLLLIFASAIAHACPDERGWKDFSTISLKFDGANALTLARFSDALYAKIEVEKSTKEMYQLNSGTVLYRGLTASELAGPSPFFMLDMPVGMTIGFLAEHFKFPCSVGSAPAQFSYVRPSGKSTIEVNGSAIRMDESAIVFDLTAVEQRERGAAIKTSGRIEFSAITSLPGDTLISDWVITRGNRIGDSANIIKPGTVAKTIEDLENSDAAEPKK